LRKAREWLKYWFRQPVASRVYCTYFDSAYLARGIVMLRSLRLHDPSARIFVLALDESCAHVLQNSCDRGVHVIETETLHAAAPELRRIREQRSLWAYYATQKPALALYIMESEPRPAAVAYIDADTWFFGDPSPMVREIGSASVGLSPHRFPASSQHLTIYGVYNAGCIYWRNDETGRRCLTDWRDDCLKWCEETAEPDGRFMNQGYLNRWPERYPGVHVVQHPGSNLAPWNIDSHLLAHDGERVTVDGQPLIFYHFSGISRDPEGQWFCHYPRFERQFDLACKSIYHPYILAVEAESRRLKELCGIDGMGSVRPMSDWPVAFQFRPPACAGGLQP
jgi:hypothetical protein